MWQFLCRRFYGSATGSSSHMQGSEWPGCFSNPGNSHQWTRCQTLSNCWEKVRDSGNDSEVWDQAILLQSLTNDVHDILKQTPRNIFFMPFPCIWCHLGDRCTTRLRASLRSFVISPTCLSRGIRFNLDSRRSSLSVCTDQSCFRRHATFFPVKARR